MFRTICIFGLLLIVALVLVVGFAAWVRDQTVFYGLVLDSTGRPVEGASVKYAYYPRTVGPDMWDGRPEGKSAMISTGPDGRFELSGRLRLIYIVRITKDRAGWTPSDRPAAFCIEPEPGDNLPRFVADRTVPVVFTVTE